MQRRAMKGDKSDEVGVHEEGRRDDDGAGHEAPAALGAEGDESLGEEVHEEGRRADEDGACHEAPAAPSDVDAALQAMGYNLEVLNRMPVTPSPSHEGREGPEGDEGHESEGSDGHEGDEGHESDDSSSDEVDEVDEGHGGEEEEVHEDADDAAAAPERGFGGIPPSIRAKRRRRWDEAWASGDCPPRQYRCIHDQYCGNPFCGPHRNKG